MNEGKDKQYVLRTCKDQGVRFVRLWFTDILGSLKSFAIMIDELEGALNEGMGFDGSSIEGFARIDESDMVAMPDPSTFTIIPWRPRDQGTARMFCDIYRPDGTPFEGDPRFVLRRNIKRAARPWLYVLCWARTRVLLFPQRRRSRAAGPGRLFRPDAA